MCTIVGTKTEEGPPPPASDPTGTLAFPTDWAMVREQGARTGRTRHPNPGLELGREHSCSLSLPGQTPCEAFQAVGPLQRPSPPSAVASAEVSMAAPGKERPGGLAEQNRKSGGQEKGPSALGARTGMGQEIRQL